MAAVVAVAVAANVVAVNAVAVNAVVDAVFGAIFGAEAIKLPSLKPPPNKMNNLSWQIGTVVAVVGAYAVSINFTQIISDRAKEKEDNDIDNVTLNQITSCVFFDMEQTLSMQLLLMRLLSRRNKAMYVYNIGYN